MARVLRFRGPARLAKGLAHYEARVHRHQACRVGLQFPPTRRGTANNGYTESMLAGAGGTCRWQTRTPDVAVNSFDCIPPTRCSWRCACGVDFPGQPSFQSPCVTLQSALALHFVAFFLSGRLACALPDVSRRLEPLIIESNVLASFAALIHPSRTFAPKKGPGGSSSHWRPSQSHTPGESDGGPQPLGKRHKPFFSLTQKALEEWHKQADEFQRSGVSVRFPCGQSDTSVTDPDSYEIKCEKGSDNVRFLFHSKSACQHFVAYIGQGFLCAAGGSLAVRKSADVYVRQARAFDERQMGKLLLPLWTAANQLITTYFKCTPGIQGAPVVNRKSA